MKKIIICLIITVLSLTLLPVQSLASGKELYSSVIGDKAPEKTGLLEKKESVEAKTLTLRLNEIKAMDKSKLNSAEKKNLHKEARSIRRRLKDISGGVYISAGTLIVVLVLLLILT
jgi:hypothetical protein